MGIRKNTLVATNSYVMIFILFMIIIMLYLLYSYIVLYRIVLY